MFSYALSCKNLAFILLCIWLTMFPRESAAMDPRFEFDSKALGVVEAPQKQSPPVVSSTRKTRKAKASSAAARKVTLYVVREDESLIDVLMDDYGFSDDEAEIAIDKICRDYNVAEIDQLRVGQRIVIPSLRRIRAQSKATPKSLPDSALHRGPRRVNLGLKAPDAALAALESGVQFRSVWGQIVPPGAGIQSADILNDPAFSLTFDPQRYPTYPTMDGGRILVDKNNSIPPLVKALILEKNPSVRIVSESPLNRKRFLKEMLGSAGFYSVAEGFSMDFGADPLLTINADFKVEKSAESVVKFDMLLVTAGDTVYPKVIKDFLGNEGVTAYEPFAKINPAFAAPKGQVLQITSRDQADIVDALLTSIAITPVRNKRLDVFAADDNGISLSVTAERYFERGGQRHVITRYDGDPINYTLFRILETKGYQTVILDKRDDFRKVAEKLLSGMRIHGAYARHKIDFDPGANYSLQMSGFKLGEPGLPGKSLFLTNLELDRFVRDLLVESGYQLTVK